MPIRSLKALAKVKGVKGFQEFIVQSGVESDGNEIDLFSRYLESHLTRFGDEGKNLSKEVINHITFFEYELNRPNMVYWLYGMFRIFILHNTVIDPGLPRFQGKYQGVGKNTGYLKIELTLDILDCYSHYRIADIDGNGSMKMYHDNYLVHLVDYIKFMVSDKRHINMMADTESNLWLGCKCEGDKTFTDTLLIYLNNYNPGFEIDPFVKITTIKVLIEGLTKIINNDVLCFNVGKIMAHIAKHDTEEIIDKVLATYTWDKIKPVKNF